LDFRNEKLFHLIEVGLRRIRIVAEFFRSEGKNN